MSCSSSDKFPKDLLRGPLPALPTPTGTATPVLPLGFLLAPLIPPGTMPLGGSVTIPPGTMPLGGAATPGLPLALAAMPACHPVVRKVSARGNKCADSQPAMRKNGSNVETNEQLFVCAFLCCLVAWFNIRRGESKCVGVRISVSAWRPDCLAMSHNAARRHLNKLYAFYVE